MLALLGSSEALFGVKMFPDVENSLSHGTLVARMHSSCWAILKALGNITGYPSTISMGCRQSRSGLQLNTFEILYLLLDHQLDVPQVSSIPFLNIGPKITLHVSSGCLLFLHGGPVPEPLASLSLLS